MAFSKMWFGLCWKSEAIESLTVWIYWLVFQIEKRFRRTKVAAS